MVRRAQPCVTRHTPMMTSLAERAARCAAAAAICLSLLAATGGVRAQDVGAPAVADAGVPVAALAQDAGLATLPSTNETLSVTQQRTSSPLDASLMAPLDASSIDAALPDAAPLAAAPLAAAPLDAAPLDAALLGVADAGVLPDAGVTAITASVETPAAPEAGTTAAASSVVKTILGLLALLALAYLGGHPRVRRLEQTLGISQVVTAGFPFVALGLIARLPSVGVLDDRVLAQVTPLLQLGLGWVGFLTGYQFEVRTLDDFPRGTAAFVSAMTSVPFVIVVAACGGLLLAFGQPWQDAVFLRDAVVLGTAATITAPVAKALARERGVAPGTQAVLTRLGLLDDIAGIVGLLFLGAYFRPATPDIAWALPGTAWLFVTIGLGVSVGIVIYLVLRRPATNVEQIALVLGSIAFAAGLAGFLRVSPVVVCFLAGLLLGNLPGDYRSNVKKVLRLLERPVYLVFLVFAGALWNVGDWRGWVLVPVFVIARLAGRALGLRAAARTEGASELAHGTAGVVAAPMGALSIAIVISFQELFAGRAVPWIVTAVIGGAIVTELVVQVALLGGRAGQPPPTAGKRLEVR